jgi:hypothetical protein
MTSANKREMAVTIFHACCLPGLLIMLPSIPLLEQPPSAAIGKVIYCFASFPEPDMSRLSALVLVGLLGSLALTTQASLAQKSDPYPSFPPLPQSKMPSLPGEPSVPRIQRLGLFLSEPNCGPIGIRARMLGQLDSLPSRIVQLDLKNTNSVAIISERITFHGNATNDESSPDLQQGYARKTHARNLEIERNVTVDAGHEVPVDSLLTGFSDVMHIELNSVTYADGTSWQPIDGKACIVTPRSL